MEPKITALGALGEIGGRIRPSKPARRIATTPQRLPSPGASPLGARPAGGGGISTPFGVGPAVNPVLVAQQPTISPVGPGGLPGTPTPVATPAVPTNPNEAAQPAQPAFPQPVPTADPTGFGGSTGFGPGENLIGTQFNLPATTREELVQRMFAATTPEMDRQAALRRESLGRQISGLGRGGMGGVNTAFGTLEAHEANQRSELLGRLSATAAGQDIDDLFRRGEFGQAERAFQNQLDLQAQGSQAGLMQALQQLGFSFDPVNNPNLTNALVGESDARFGAAQAAAAPFGALAGSAGQLLPQFI